MGNFYRPNVERPFDFVANVYGVRLHLTERVASPACVRDWSLGGITFMRLTFESDIGIELDISYLVHTIRYNRSCAIHVGLRSQDKIRVFSRTTEIRVRCVFSVVTYIGLRTFNPLIATLEPQSNGPS